MKRVYSSLSQHRCRCDPRIAVERVSDLLLGIADLRGTTGSSEILRRRLVGTFLERHVEAVTAETVQRKREDVPQSLFNGGSIVPEETILEAEELWRAADQAPAVVHPGQTAPWQV